MGHEKMELPLEIALGACFVPSESKMTEGQHRTSPDRVKLTTVLSIDGGSVRVIIPATILAFLKKSTLLRD
jgi:hypothetical protein